MNDSSTELTDTVVSIISSPTLSSDVRHKATDLLHNLNNAYKQDKAGTSASAAEAEVVGGPGGAGAEKRSKWNVFARSSPGQGTAAPTTTSEERPPYPHIMSDGLPPTSEAEAIVEHVPISSGHILRVHGIHMDRRRRFEIRVNAAGKLELWDADLGQIWSRHKEKERDELSKKELDAKEKAEKKAKKSGKSKDKQVGEETADGEATASATDDEAVFSPDGDGRLNGSVTSVELDGLDREAARVTESGGVKRRGTVKDRLSALVRSEEQPRVDRAPAQV